MTEKQVKGYIKYNLQMEPRHDCYALAQAITDIYQWIWTMMSLN